MTAELNPRGPVVAGASVTKQRTHSELIQVSLCLLLIYIYVSVCVCWHYNQNNYQLPQGCVTMATFSFYPSALFMVSKRRRKKNLWRCFEGNLWIRLQFCLCSFSFIVVTFTVAELALKTFGLCINIWRCCFLDISCAPRKPGLQESMT